MDCVFCREDGGDVLWQDDTLRVVLADEHDYPGFCRVIWNRHVAEFSDLAEGDRDRVMRAVYAVERAMRRILQSVKVNLASLGNQVPHVHWHVIPRFRGDRHFPGPIWGAPAPGAHSVTRTGGSEFTQDLRQALSRAVVQADGSDSV